MLWFFFPMTTVFSNTRLVLAFTVRDFLVLWLAASSCWLWMLCQLPLGFEYILPNFSVGCANDQLILYQHILYIAFCAIKKVIESFFILLVQFMELVVCEYNVLAPVFFCCIFKVALRISADTLPEKLLPLCNAHHTSGYILWAGYFLAIAPYL